MTELSLVIIKPDAISRSLVEEIEHRLSLLGLCIIRRRTVILDMEFVKSLYRWSVVHHYKEIEEYLCGQPLPVWVVSGDEAVKKCFQLKADLRKEFAVDRLHTLIHCPDSQADFKRERELLFLESEELL